MHATYFAGRGQRGISLVVVLMLLVIVTLLGIGGARIVLLGERSARNDRDYQLAWQSAEAALLDAQFDIRGGGGVPVRDALFNEFDTSHFVEGCNTQAEFRGLCAPAAAGKPVWLTADFLNTSANAPSVAFGTFTGRTFDAGAAGVKPVQPPRYIIEWMVDRRPGIEAGVIPNKGKPKPIMYRITAIGFGTRTDVQVVLQAAFKKESLL